VVVSEAAGKNCRKWNENQKNQNKSTCRYHAIYVYKWEIKKILVEIYMLVQLFLSDDISSCKHQDRIFGC
jgi:hypothetical protein